MSRHAWAACGTATAPERCACTKAGCPALRDRNGGHYIYRRDAAHPWFFYAPLCEGTPPAKPQRVHRSRAGGRGGERRRAGEP